ncbi:hypothetical protein SERLA73DRAFT_186883 [Serpula lacrymans var. lacrymans S7.3]|uniref:Uncharacterized protein n=2 Tax=Serpula lacrymans var. lacrymans TaxID=341189 RepID=F8Q814_SERL3|nr:uncharacterized protein SERLADRAFT_476156 [Serpula lacrymans var. lacrymans S7.9]EGN95702.1 hypothetical protein SERLA73DRAFT_186883 [Serpula lacrymans var. lacrymans S7.3]EGO21228.1 hypothetical protein SERLADRAFT_476156 [Serpula lacrymans var. lacrymans S7.9]
MGYADLLVLPRANRPIERYVLRSHSRPPLAHVVFLCHDSTIENRRDVQTSGRCHHLEPKNGTFDRSLPDTILDARCVPWKTLTSLCHR